MKYTNEHFQKIITKPLLINEIRELGLKNVLAELSELQKAESIGQIIKEACDVYIVSEVMVLYGTFHQISMHYRIMNAMIDLVQSSNVSFDYALQKVVDSNMTKFILESELVSAQKYFNELGIRVRFDQLENEFYGAYSVKDQTIDGKLYERDKLMKGPNYLAIDESTEWFIDKAKKLS